MRIIRGMDEIVRAAAPVEAEICGWNEGEALRVKMRRPALVNMAADGKIPNPLLKTVNVLLNGAAEAIAAVDVAESSRAVRHIAQAALVEPKLEELEAAGVQLTDEQYMEIYAWVLGGLDGIDRFRGRKRDGTGEHGDGDGGQGQPDPGRDQ